MGQKKTFRRTGGETGETSRGINVGICQPPFSYRRMGPPPRSGQGGKGDVLYGPRYSPHFLLSSKGSGFPDSARMTEPREPKESYVCVGGGKREEGKKGRAKLVLFVLPIVRVLLSAAGCNIIDEFTRGVNASQFFRRKKHPRDDNFLSFSFPFSRHQKKRKVVDFFIIDNLTVLLLRIELSSFNQLISNYFII